MKNVSDKLVIALKHPLETVICVLLLAMTFVVFGQVVARYVLQTPLSWSEEMARFMLMWLSMLSAAYGFKTKSHFALKLLVGRFSSAAQKIIELVVYLVVVLFFAVLLYFSVIFVIGVKGHTAPALGISMQIPYASMVVGCMLILYESLRSMGALLFDSSSSVKKN